MYGHAVDGLAVAGLCSAPFLLTACGGGGGGGGDEEAVPAVVAVDTATARVEMFAVRVETFGEVVARPGRVAELAAPGESRVSAIYVVPGQSVKAGDSLVALDRSVWSADVRRAEAAAEAARQALERATSLVQQGILPRKEEELAAADAASAEAELAAARRVERLAVLRSPIAGVVADMNAVLEANVDPAAMLVRVVDPDALEGLFRLAPEDAALVEPGADVQVTTTSATTDVLARGTVRAVSPALDPATRTVEVRVRLASPARTLRLGEALTGRIAVAVHEGAVVVPVSALVPSVDGEQVFVVDAGGVAHARTVRVGGRSTAEAEIVEGLAGGEIVVTTGAYGLTDGATVRAGGAAARPDPEAP